MNYAAEQPDNPFCTAVARSVLVFCLVVASTLIGQDAVDDRQDSSRRRRIPDVMYVPTPHDVAAEMLKLAAVQDGDVVYDLGCGDGRILISAAKRFGCRAVGIDIDPLRERDAQRNVRLNGVEHLVTIEQGDLFDADFSEATVVTLYLSTKYNTKLLPQLSALKPGSRIVSHQFGITGIQPDRTVTLISRDGHQHKLLLWTAPLR